MGNGSLWVYHNNLTLVNGLFRLLRNGVFLGVKSPIDPNHLIPIFRPGTSKLTSPSPTSTTRSTTRTRPQRFRFAGSVRGTAEAGAVDISGSRRWHGRLAGGRRSGWSHRAGGGDFTHRLGWVQKPWELMGFQLPTFLNW